jgi:hypothetical protein
MSCLFYCLDHDLEYCELLLDNDGLYYIWYPNENSQSRIDEHYGFMLSGYTMNGSVNILKFMRNCKTLKKDDGTRQDYRAKSLNMCIYSYITFQSFIAHVKETDYVPALELDWTLLRDSCRWLRDNLRKRYSDYSYIEVISEIVHVIEHSDVLYHEPWYRFDDYILGDVPEFEWSLDDLLKVKEKDS